MFSQLQFAQSTLLYLKTHFISFLFQSIDCLCECLWFQMYAFEWPTIVAREGSQHYTPGHTIIGVLLWHIIQHPIQLKYPWAQLIIPLSFTGVFPWSHFQSLREKERTSIISINQSVLFKHVSCGFGPVSDSKTTVCNLIISGCNFMQEVVIIVL